MHRETVGLNKTVVHNVKWSDYSDQVHRNAPKKAEAKLQVLSNYWVNIKERRPSNLLELNKTFISSFFAVLRHFGSHWGTKFRWAVRFNSFRIAWFKLTWLLSWLKISNFVHFDLNMSDFDRKMSHFDREIVSFWSRNLLKKCLIFIIKCFM